MPKKAKELSAIAISKLKAEGRYAVGGADDLYFRIVGNSRAWGLARYRRNTNKQRRQNHSSPPRYGIRQLSRNIVG